MKSAKKRLIFQFIIVLIFIISNDIKLFNTRVNLLEKLISNNYINYIFVCFCVLIVINGSNFFDGLNTLSTGYYLLITSIMIYLNFMNVTVFQYLFLDNLLFILIIIYIYNLLNKVFIGDSGSYILGFIFQFF